MRVKSYLGLKFNFSHCNFLCGDVVPKNVSLSLPPPPPPISLLSKISLIKTANTYFSHTARIGREYHLCAFFTLHRLRKPQGTQSVELRSTSQRNNRNVLMDWDNSIQNKFPRNLKPAGFPKGCPLWQTEKEGGVWGGRKTCSVGVSFLP